MKFTLTKSKIKTTNGQYYFRFKIYYGTFANRTQPIPVPALKDPI